MKSPTPSPSFLIRNQYSYCFRMRVPPDLQPVIKKTELRYSLKTGYLGFAKSKARLLAGLFQNLFDIFNNIIRLLGDLPIGQISKQKCQEFKQHLLGLPRDYFRSKKKYESMPVDQVVAMAEEPFLSVKTVNKYIDNLGALLKFGVSNADLLVNPAEGLRIKTKKAKAYEERDIFSNEDLALIFRSEQYLKDRMKPAWRFWLPVLALYTGARLEEIYQLKLSDIENSEGIWIINIQGESVSADATASKRTKTKAANRIVPLHPFIVDDLRFIKHVENLERKGEKRLFPELKKQSHRWGHYPSRWFGDFKKKLVLHQTRKPSIPSGIIFRIT